MKIKSVFKNGGVIPDKYTCDGENINPPLEFSELPEETKSIALFVEGVDNPMKIMVHWVVWNIPPERIQVFEKLTPMISVQGVNDFGQNSYNGPCPVSGKHQYTFKVFALNTLLNLPASSRKSDVERAMQGHILDKTELVGYYSRQKEKSRGFFGRMFSGK